MSHDATCLFCRIVRGEIPAQRVAESEAALAFRDINPQAPTQVLVIPRRHVASLAEATDAVELAAVFALAREVAAAEGLEAGGYRVVSNVGAGAGQTVFHLHVHVLGGRGFAWPPG